MIPIKNYIYEIAYCDDEYDDASYWGMGIYTGKSIIDEESGDRLYDFELIGGVNERSDERGYFGEGNIMREVCALNDMDEA
jgi:hypothetical protein